MNLINGLGGKANITALENCITRLRVTLADPSLLNEELIIISAGSPPLSTRART